jgi:hypothetical protein
VKFNRRQFVQVLSAAASALQLEAQIAATNPSPGTKDWGGPVVDCHHHLRRTPEANIVHPDGCGVTNAMILARENSAADIAASRDFPIGRGRFERSLSGKEQ